MNDIKTIIEAIRRGYNPVTGELFNTNILSDDPMICKEIIKLALTTQDGLTYRKQESQNALNRNVDLILEELRRWRLDAATQLGLPAYYVFTDKELFEIAAGDVVEKADLLLIKGISHKKFEAYGEDIFSILRPFIAEEIILANSDTEGIISEENISISNYTEQKNTNKTQSKGNKHYKSLYIPTKEQINGFPYNIDGTMYISDITKYFNSIRNSKINRAFKYSDISDWLISEGYISETINEIGKKQYIATAKGISNGIKNEEKSGREGKYNVLLCTYDAQKMIVRNLDVIAGYTSIDKRQNEELIETDDTNTDITCKKCMLYRNETCFGGKEICEDFRHAVDISEDEIAMWPKEMTGPYGTLHKRW